MSLFIANLAFKEDLQLLHYSKVGILAGSVVSGFVGFLLIRMRGRPPKATLDKTPSMR